MHVNHRQGKCIMIDKYDLEIIFLIILSVGFILINFIPYSYKAYYIEKNIDKYGYDVVKTFISVLSGLVLAISLFILVSVY